jgi:hypothetical protein
MIVYICKKNVEIDESLKERESEIEVLYRKINELELLFYNCFILIIDLFF